MAGQGRVRVASSAQARPGCKLPRRRLRVAAAALRVPTVIVARRVAVFLRPMLVAEAARVWRVCARVSMCVACKCGWRACDHHAAVHSAGVRVQTQSRSAGCERGAWICVSLSVRVMRCCPRPPSHAAASEMYMSDAPQAQERVLSSQLVLQDDSFTPTLPPQKLSSEPLHDCCATHVFGTRCWRRARSCARDSTHQDSGCNE